MLFYQLQYFLFQGKFDIYILSIHNLKKEFTSSVFLQKKLIKIPKYHMLFLQK